MFQPGDRVRWVSLGDDGFPIVRYGFVGGTNGDHSRVAVMLDGDLKGDTVVDRDQLQPVTITNVELRLRGTDLITDPSLRHGLVNLWTAEADQAGLEIRAVEPVDDTVELPLDRGCTLAQVHSGGRRYVLRADRDGHIDDAVRVHAATPDTWL